jgi:hypothetical protein
MDFGYTPEQEALRQEVGAFIAEHLTPEVLSEMEGLSEGFGVSRSVARDSLECRSKFMARPETYLKQGS